MALRAPSPSMDQLRSFKEKPPLFAAIEANDLVRVSQLIEEDKRVVATKCLGFLPIHFAVELAAYHIVKELLQQGASPYSRAPDQMTPLSRAAEKGFADIKDILQQHEVKITEYNRAAMIGDWPTVANLLSKAGKMDTRAKDGYTPFLRSAHFGFTAIAEYLLDQEVADIEEKTAKKGYTALNIATRQGHVRMLVMLLSKGARVDDKARDGYTPLLRAVQWLNSKSQGRQQEHCRFTAIVEHLLHHGTNIEEKTPGGNTPLMLAANGGFSSIIKMLLSKGARVDTKNKQGFCPLTAAARRRHTEVCELLLANGSDPEVMWPLPVVPLLHRAAVTGYLGLVQLLLSYKGNINSMDRLGGTPLLCACQQGQVACVRTLLQAGADPMLPDIQGSFPIHIAAQCDHTEVVRILLEHGCRPDQVILFILYCHKLKMAHKLCH